MNRLPYIEGNGYEHKNSDAHKKLNKLLNKPRKRNLNELDILRHSVDITVKNVDDEFPYRWEVVQKKNNILKKKHSVEGNMLKEKRATIGSNFGIKHRNNPLVTDRHETSIQNKAISNPYHKKLILINKQYSSIQNENNSNRRSRRYLIKSRLDMCNDVDEFKKLDPFKRTYIENPETTSLFRK